MIGGNVDLDLLSLFPQKDARIMGGKGRKGKLFKVNNGGERKWKSQHPNEEEGALYSPRMKSDHYRNFNPEIPALGAEFLARGRNFRPPYKISGPNFCPPYRGLHHKRLSRISQGGGKHQYENGCNFCIRTPFLMILGSLESPQRPLQRHP
jgi:hypothetical protein